MKVRFWGVRASLPCPGRETVRMGGNTSCVEVQAGKEHIIFDAGSGIRELGKALVKRGAPIKTNLFFSHVHHDHIQGFPFFVPLYLPAAHISIYGEKRGKDGIKEQLVKGVMCPPSFPYGLSVMKSQKEFIDVKENETIVLSPKVSVITRRMNHPNGAIGYRVESMEKGKRHVFAYCTDTEHYPEPDKNVLDLAKGADAFVYDSSYTDEEYEKMTKWGHSTWREAVKIAKLAKVKRTMLFHHWTTHDDKTMEKILAAARKVHKGVYLASEGLELSL